MSPDRRDTPARAAVFTTRKQLHVFWEQLGSAALHFGLIAKAFTKLLKEGTVNL